MKLIFTASEANHAANEWHANCGPMSLAAALMIDLPTVRCFIPGFDAKGYTNPTMMEAALATAGILYNRTTKLKTQVPCEGLNRIQWEGPWLEPGVPAGAAYGYTHWIAYAEGHVFCSAVGLIGWVPIIEWRDLVAKVCREEIKRCTGWHITHHYNFEVLAK